MTRVTSVRIKLFLVVLLLTALACDASSLSPFTARSDGTPVPTLSNVIPSPATAAPVVLRPSAAGWIAFVRDDNIWLIHPDGSGPKQVTHDLPASTGPGGFELHWSPDGRLLAFSHAGTISLLDIASLSTTQLVNDTAGGFDWSADGQNVVYDASLSGAGSASANAGISTVQILSKAVRQLGATSAAHPVMLAPLWASDNSHLIFSTPQDADPGGVFLLGLVPPAVSSLMPQHPGACAWSPIEPEIACVNTDPAQGKAPGILLFDRDGKQTQGIALPEGAFQPQLGPWSLDGARLAIIYSSTASGSDETTGFLTLESGEFKTISPGRIADWSPDARWAVMEPLAGSPTPGLTVVEVSSGASALLADGSSARWQPDAPPTLVTGASPDQAFCMDTSVGFVHQKPKGYFLQFCVGSQHFTYGALEKGVYAVGPNAVFFVYVGNSGFIYAARMGDKTLTRIGNVREFRAIWTDGIEPSFQIRFLPGYPHLVQVIEQDFNQHETFTLPRRIFKP